MLIFYISFGLSDAVARFELSRKCTPKTNLPIIPVRESASESKVSIKRKWHTDEQQTARNLVFSLLHVLKTRKLFFHAAFFFY